MEPGTEFPGGKAKTRDGTTVLPGLKAVGGKVRGSENSDWKGSRTVLLSAIGGGVMVICLYSRQRPTFDAELATASLALAVAGAALFVGGLVGFLFGVPLSAEGAKGPRQTRSPTGSSEDKQRADTSTDLVLLPESPYRANTNLEQISDWLTKILVGVGLVEFSSIRDGILSIARSVELGVGKKEDLVLSTTILIYYFICGFFLSYLWARLHLAGLLSDSEREDLHREGMRAGFGKGEREGFERGEKELARVLSNVGDSLAPPMDSAPQAKPGTKKVVLWVDDRPSNNILEREMLGRQFGIAWETATSTDEALARLKGGQSYVAVISDMARPEGVTAGYDLLERLQADRGLQQPPFIIYSGDGDHWDALARSKGALGSASSMARLTLLVGQALAQSTSPGPAAPPTPKPADAPSTPSP